MNNFTIPLDQVGINNVAEVGGKNSSLGEMIQNLSKEGVSVPSGYAITASAYRFYLESTGLSKFIRETLEKLDTSDLADLSLRGKTIREKIIETEFPNELRDAIVSAHKTAEEKYGAGADFAVRSSATAEDLPDASFAGEHETFLNICGTEQILLAVRKAFASLFTDRAISYRVDKGFDHFQVALSVGVQKMVRSDIGCSGVMFTLDTESGFPDVVIINGAWGLGETVVQGQVTPDEFIVYKKTLGAKDPNGNEFIPIIEKKLGDKQIKLVYAEGEKSTKIVEPTETEKRTFVLTNEEIIKLAKWGDIIEKHYSKVKGRWTPMDTEWAKDGITNELFIVQARPETVNSRKDYSMYKEYLLLEKGEAIVKGASVGSKIATGTARVILNASEMRDFKQGEVLVTTITDPDWEPIMKIASAIVTDKGGRTSHAAIVARELGIPAVVGSVDATQRIKTGDLLTVDTTGSFGVVYKGTLKFNVEEHNITKIPKPRTHVYMNIATPDMAFEKSFLPNEGVGLAREEFIALEIGVHPQALIKYNELPKDVKDKVDKKTYGYDSKPDFFVDKLSYGIGKIAAAFYPKPVILRLSDFKTNEYRTLIGGELFEPEEENPMIGWRGASRYYSPDFIDSFLLEVKAIKRVRDEMGLTNLIVMVPFCRTPEEGQRVIKIMEENGLKRGENGLKFYVMCEIPSNVVRADAFLEIFDGMSIGSNDLTQLALGIDRDGNEKIRGIANENEETVKVFVTKVIRDCKARGKYIGICGQAPSDYPDFLSFLIKEGIDSVSLNPDTVIKSTLAIYEEELNLSKTA